MAIGLVEFRGCIESAEEHAELMLKALAGENPQAELDRILEND